MNYTDRTLQLQADLFKALAHPTRLKILDYLRDGEHCVCEFTEHMDLEQANVSQHLAVLKRQGLVSSRKDGLRVIYRVCHPEVFLLLETMMRILHAEAQNTLEALEESSTEM